MTKTLILSTAAVAALPLAWYRLVQQRRLLMELDDYRLADLGISRADAARAAHHQRRAPLAWIIHERE